MMENRRLSQSKEMLEGTLNDLRRVLTISQEQHEEEIEEIYEKNRVLKNEAQSLSSALRSSH